MIKKIIVRISVASFDGLDERFARKVAQEFPFYYTPLTRIETMLRLAHRKCQLPNPYHEEKTHFMVWLDGERNWVDESGRVAKLYQHLGRNGRIDIEYVFANGIGGFIDEEDGIVFFYHAKEMRHVPHVHVSYQGEEISIEILTLKVKGKFKNKKKQRKAIQYVNENQNKLLSEYNNKTNGLRVHNYEI